MTLTLRAWVAVTAFAHDCRRRLADEVGEGVISTAIAVLIMAIIGLAMWVTFDRVFTGAGQDIEQNIGQIG